MKILLSSQIRQADAYTIQHEPVSSLDLMERASMAFTNWFMDHFNQDRSIKIVAGSGNNGGDGLAVARLLLEKGYQVKVYAIKSKGSPDFEANYQRLTALTAIHLIENDQTIPIFQSRDIIIDALFGSGLSRPAEGLYAQVIQQMNDAAATIVAIDIPSGLFSDKHSTGESIVRADHTVSFQVPKLAFFIRENQPFVGDWQIVDIGLHESFISHLDSSYTLVDQEIIKKLLIKRSKFDHKGNFGRVKIIAGGYGKMGAAVLSAKACLKSGVGLLTVHIPECGYDIIQTAVPEAMATVDPSLRCFSQVPDLKGMEVVGVGPGLGTSQKTIHAFSVLLDQFRQPMVIDADGLNIMGQHRELLEKIPQGSVLTPHPKEFERIAGEYENDFERLALQKSFAKKYRVNLVVKGAYTTVTTPQGQVYFNPTGNPGMATAGSGDVLTGIITALLGQNKDPLKAAILGVYMHGLAGDLACRENGWEATTANEIIHYLSRAFKHLS